MGDMSGLADRDDSGREQSEIISFLIVSFTTPWKDEWAPLFFRVKTRNNEEYLFLHTNSQADLGIDKQDFGVIYVFLLTVVETMCLFSKVYTKE